MTTQDTYKILKIYISENDRFEGAPLYTALINALKAQGIAGATVLKGIAGYAAGDQVHAAKPLQTSDNLPVIIEVIDREERILGALPALAPLVSKGLIVLEDIQVVSYQHPACGEGDGPAACGLTQPKK